MSEYSRAQQDAAQAAARAGDADRGGQILAHMRQEGATEAEVSKAAEVVVDTLLGSGPPSPRMQAVVSVFLDTDTEEEAEWLARHGSGSGGGEEQSAAYAQPAAFADPEDELLFAGVQRLWDQVIRCGEEPGTAGARRVASAMLARDEITPADQAALFALAIDEDREAPPWGEWLTRARERITDVRSPEAG